MNGSDVTVLQAPARMTLEEMRRRLGPHLEAAGAERAIVFGSYARGTADGFSDLDLVVVRDTSRPFVERGLELVALLDALPIPVDLLVYTPEELARGMAADVGLFATLAREGVTIYERHEP